MLQLYNTLTRKIEDFKPINPPIVGYYSCGPTVYDYAHIGHARTYIFADVLERVLKYLAFNVKRVMNITDVGHLISDSDSGEDKMEKGAEREGKTVWDIAKFYTDDFMKMLSKLNIHKPEIICKATDYIPEMIDLIKILEKKEFTYRISDGIYFDTSKFPEYGKLTGQNFEKLQKSLKSGARVEMVPGKKHPTDFAMWKLTSKDFKRQMEWDSPWGRGFPGWHIECSAMAMKHLGDTIDIHTGGVDHIPIHHTNEIVQSEAATGKLFVRFWLHADHLLVEGEKMSKSMGNFYRLDDIEKKGFDPLAMRYLFLTGHYRMQMNFTWQALEAAQIAFIRLKEQMMTLKVESEKNSRVSLSEDKLRQIDIYRSKFTDAINNDLNTPQAVSLIWEVIKSNLPLIDKYDLVLLFDEVLGLGLADTEANKEEKIPDEIMKLAEEREILRKQARFQGADMLRKKIEEKGYIVQDSPSGSNIKKDQI